MKLTIDDVFQRDYEFPEYHRSVDAYVRPNQQVIKTIVPKQYVDEINALCNYAGIENLNSGMTIKMTLQEILSIIPKKRPRIESYKMLITFLKDEMNVDLILTSRKTK